MSSKGNINLHYLQQEILKKLALANGLHFNQMLIEGLESEHVNYHIKKLVEFKLLIKKGEVYYLTDLGKDYVNSLDDNTMEVEKQPKTSILINGKRLNDKGEVEYLVSRRLKQPYFGKIGKLGGKVKFGETILEAAQRELFEETGLTAKKYTLETIYHKLRYRENNEFVQDVIFYIFFVTDFKGDFISRIPFQENLWISPSNIDQYRKDFHEDLKFSESMEPKALSFVEDVAVVAEGY